MAIDDDGSAEAVGAEKSPRNVRRFVWGLLAGVVVFLGAVVLYMLVFAPSIPK